jgi:hypothetical protein
MTNHPPPTLTTKLSTLLGQPLLFVFSVALSVLAYYAWQVLGLLVWFFTYCCGTSGDGASTWLAAGGLVLHIGLISWLFRRRVLYTTWLAWAISVGLALGLFVYAEMLPHS